MSQMLLNLGYKALHRILPLLVFDYPFLDAPIDIIDVYYSGFSLAINFTKVNIKVVFCVKNCIAYLMSRQNAALSSATFFVFVC